MSGVTGLPPHKLPPPAVLPKPSSTELHYVEPTDQLARIYFLAGAHPTAWDSFRYFGPTSSHFDHHRVDAKGAPSTGPRGIVYVSEQLVTCCTGVFQLGRIIDRGHGVPWLVGFYPTRRPMLLDVAGLWAIRAGASSLLNNGPKGVCRAWARAIYDTFPALDGIAYESSMAGGTRAFALFERSSNAMPSHPSLNIALAHPALDGPIRHVGLQIGYHVT